MLDKRRHKLIQLSKYLSSKESLFFDSEELDDLIKVAEESDDDEGSDEQLMQISVDDVESMQEKRLQEVRDSEPPNEPKKVFWESISEEDANILLDNINPSGFYRVQPDHWPISNQDPFNIISEFFRYKVDLKYPNIRLKALNKLYTLMVGGFNLGPIIFFTEKLDKRYPDSVTSFGMNLDMDQYVKLELQGRYPELDEYFSKQFEHVSAETMIKKNLYKVYPDAFIEKLMSVDEISRFDLEGIDTEFVKLNKDKFLPVAKKMFDVVKEYQKAEDPYGYGWRALTAISEGGFHIAYPEVVKEYNVIEHMSNKLYAKYKYWNIDSDMSRTISIAKEEPELLLGSRDIMLNSSAGKDVLKNIGPRLYKVIYDEDGGEEWAIGAEGLIYRLRKLFFDNTSSADEIGEENSLGKNEEFLKFYKDNEDEMSFIFKKILKIILGPATQTGHDGNSSWSSEIMRAEDALHEILAHDLDFLFEDEIKNMLSENLKFMKQYKPVATEPPVFVAVIAKAGPIIKQLKLKYGPAYKDLIKEVASKLPMLFIYNIREHFSEMDQYLAQGLVDIVKLDRGTRRHRSRAIFEIDEGEFAKRFDKESTIIAKDLLERAPVIFFGSGLDKKYPDLKVAINRATNADDIFSEEHFLETNSPIDLLIDKQPVAYFSPKNINSTRSATNYGEVLRSEDKRDLFKEYPEKWYEAAISLTRSAKASGYGSSGVSGFFMLFYSGTPDKGWGLSEDQKLKVSKSQEASDFVHHYLSASKSPRDINYYFRNNVWSFFKEHTSEYIEKNVEYAEERYKHTSPQENEESEVKSAEYDLKDHYSSFFGPIFFPQEASRWAGHRAAKLFNYSFNISPEQSKRLREAFPDLVRRIMAVYLEPASRVMQAAPKSRVDGDYALTLYGMWDEHPEFISDLIKRLSSNELHKDFLNSNKIYKFLKEVSRRINHDENEWDPTWIRDDVNAALASVREKLSSDPEHSVEIIGEELQKEGETGFDWKMIKDIGIRFAAVNPFEFLGAYLPNAKSSKDWPSKNATWHRVSTSAVRFLEEFVTTVTDDEIDEILIYCIKNIDFNSIVRKNSEAAFILTEFVEKEKSDDVAFMYEVGPSIEKMLSESLQDPVDVIGAFEIQQGYSRFITEELVDEASKKYVEKSNPEVAMRMVIDHWNKGLSKNIETLKMSLEKAADEDPYFIFKLISNKEKVEAGLLNRALKEAMLGLAHEYPDLSSEERESLVMQVFGGGTIDDSSSPELKRNYDILMRGKKKSFEKNSKEFDLDVKSFFDLPWFEPIYKKASKNLIDSITKMGDDGGRKLTGRAGEGRRKRHIFLKETANNIIEGYAAGVSDYAGLQALRNVHYKSDILNDLIFILNEMFKKDFDSANVWAYNIRLDGARAAHATSLVTHSANDERSFWASQHEPIIDSIAKNLSSQEFEALVKSPEASAYFEHPPSEYNKADWIRFRVFPMRIDSLLGSGIYKKIPRKDLMEIFDFKLLGLMPEGFSERKLEEIKHSQEFLQEESRRQSAWEREKNLVERLNLIKKGGDSDIVEEYLDHIEKNRQADISLTSLYKISKPRAIKILRSEMHELTDKFINFFKSIAPEVRDTDDDNIPGRPVNAADQELVQIVRDLLKQNKYRVENCDGTGQDAKVSINKGCIFVRSFYTKKWKNVFTLNQFFSRYPSLSSEFKDIADEVRVNAAVMRSVKDKATAQGFFKNLDNVSISGGQQEVGEKDSVSTTDLSPNIKISRAIHQDAQRPDSFWSSRRYCISQNNTTPTKILYDIGKKLIHAGDGVNHTDVGISGFTSAWAYVSLQEEEGLDSGDPGKFVVEQYQSDYPVFLVSIFNATKNASSDYAEIAEGHSMNEETVHNAAIEKNKNLINKYPEDYKDARKHFDYISKAYPYLVLINCIEVAMKTGLEYIYVLKNAPFYADITNKDKAKKLYEDIPRLVSSDKEFISTEECWRLPANNNSIEIYQREIKKLTGKDKSYDFSLTPAQNVKKRVNKKKDVEWQPNPEKIKRLEEISGLINSKLPDVSVPKFFNPIDAIRFLNTEIRGKVLGKGRFNREFGKMIGELSRLKRAWDRADRIIKISKFSISNSRYDKTRLLNFAVYENNLRTQGFENENRSHSI